MKQLLEEYAPRVYRFALRLCGDRRLAEDLAQEALLRAWRARGSLREADKAPVWLLRITANVWRDAQRRRRHRDHREEPLQADPPSRAADAEQQTLKKEDAQRALAALDALPTRQREVLYLHACEELSLAEIADVLEISRDAAKASLSVARKQMRQKLSDLFFDVTGNRNTPSE